MSSWIGVRDASVKQLSRGGSKQVAKQRVATRLAPVRGCPVSTEKDARVETANYHSSMTSENYFVSTVHCFLPLGFPQI